jgi:transposase
MLRETVAGQVYLARGATDMRKNIDSLAAIVAGEFNLDVTRGSWFVFCNSGRDKLKILYFEGNGFWLYYRRLERGRFRWPTSGDSETIQVTSRQLRWLLDGLSIEQSQAHRPVHASAIV